MASKSPLMTDSPDPSIVGKKYRTSAVPDTITDEMLGTYYLNLDALVPTHFGCWPDSTHNSAHGASCWPCWTIYRNPKDVPSPYVARLSVHSRPTPHLIVGDTLDAVRAKLPPGLKRYMRWSIDWPAIVESWS